MELHVGEDCWITSAANSQLYLPLPGNPGVGGVGVSTSPLMAPQYRCQYDVEYQYSGLYPIPIQKRYPEIPTATGRMQSAPIPIYYTLYY